MSAFGGEPLAQYDIALRAKLDELASGMDAAERLVTQRVSVIEGKASGIRFGFNLAPLARFGKALAGVAIGLGAAAVAAGALADKADRELGRSLAIAGQDAAGAQDQFAEFAQGLARDSAQSTNAIKALGSTIATLGKVGGKDLENLTTLSVALAARFGHMGLTGKRASQLIGEGLRDGDFGAFERFGIDLENVSRGQGQLNRLLEEGRKGLSDLAANAGTAGGNLKRIKNALQDSLVGLVRLTGGGTGGQLGGAIATGLEFIADEFAKVKPFADDAFASMLTFFGFDYSTQLGGFENAIKAMVGLFEAATDAAARLFIMFNLSLSKDEVRRAFELLDIEFEAQRKRLNEKFAKDAAERGLGDLDFPGSVKGGRNDSVQTAIGNLRIPGSDRAQQIRQRMLEELKAIKRAIVKSGRVSVSQRGLMRV